MDYQTGLKGKYLVIRDWRQSNATLEDGTIIAALNVCTDRCSDVANLYVYLPNTVSIHSNSLFTI